MRGVNYLIIKELKRMIFNIFLFRMMSITRPSMQILYDYFLLNRMRYRIE